MPEILKKENGDIDYTKIFMAIAAAVVLILQQWQSYRIAEIQAQGEVNKVNFLSKEKVYDIEKDFSKRLQSLENQFMPRDMLDERLKRLEDKVYEDKQ